MMKPELIPEWRRAWRMLSVQVATLAVAWGTLPADTQAMLLAAVGGPAERVPAILGLMLILARGMDPPPTRRAGSRLAGVIRAAYAEMQARADRLGFVVIEGRRTQKRQAELVAAGASRTMQGRHLTGHAIDVMATVAGKGRWDWPLYPAIAAVVKAHAQARGVALVWGGDWAKLRDGPHYELDRKVYPA